LRVPQEEALARDDPMSYLYTVRLVEESEQENTEGNLPRQNDSDAEKCTGSEMEVKAKGLRYLSLIVSYTRYSSRQPRPSLFQRIHPSTFYQGLH